MSNQYPPSQNPDPRYGQGYQSQQIQYSQQSQYQQQPRYQQPQHQQPQYPQGYSYPPQNPPKKKSTEIWLLVIIAILLVMVVICVVALVGRDASTELPYQPDSMQGTNSPVQTNPPVPDTNPAATEPQPTDPPAPEVTMSRVQGVSATSSLYQVKTNQTIRRSPERLIDGKVGTSWVEDGYTWGKGESVTFHLDGEYTVSGMEIYAGYQLDSERYYRNCRTKEITVSFSDGSSVSFTLLDIMSAQKLDWAAVETTSVTITIVDVYHGEYDATAISEVTLY